MNCLIVIPAYHPNDALLALVDKLSKFKTTILIINDGSTQNHLPIFKALDKYKFVKILHHAFNQGKGNALKTGFKYFLENYPNLHGVITADADGQHCTEDILNFCEVFNHQPQTLLLGCRSFDKKVPWRSRIGNKLSCATFRLLVGQKLRDTQTGLRAIPKEFLASLLKIQHAGYDYELEMLLTAFKLKIPVREIDIQTIYTNDNQNSHFHPLIDAIKIYLVFLRFLGKSLLDKLTKN
jgi:dolichol-phosphate mannosyltransferase